ncbi:Membrane attack complex component/perforin (MACPF) domain [Dillenia turbinata]|uniref:Membrane attack complex component/perforin (MACPF) domain n=1 Tax=Dillenia turbinata TaxID=194707 RepID=A0AAN8UFB1_9MAGN
MRGSRIIEEEEEEKWIGIRAVESLGLGFDLTSDFRLKFAKGGGRLVVLDEVNKRDIVVPAVGGGITIPNVSQDIRFDKGDQIRFKSDVLQFNQMSELLNQKSSLQGKVPSGYFNSIFNFSGAWLNDSADTKCLAFDGYFISLYYLHLIASQLVLQDRVRKSVPSRWDPASLSRSEYCVVSGTYAKLSLAHGQTAILCGPPSEPVWDKVPHDRFIQTYGTHVIVGMAVGGQDVVCVRQNHSSTIPAAELKGYLEELGDSLFSDGRSPSLLEQKLKDGKRNVPEVFSRILQSNPMQLSSVTETSSKDGLTLIWSKRGGDVLQHSHSSWLQSVAENPDAILFKFVPITSLLIGVPGSGYLSHAINLYTRCELFDSQILQENLVLLGLGWEGAGGWGGAKTKNHKFEPRVIKLTAR